MNREHVCIVVTGLPASGKTTIGKKVAQGLNLACLDKDDYLESLFAAKGTGGLNWRRQLSRESDELFQRDAKAYQSVVLISHWRPRGDSAATGTPVEWIAEQYAQVIELYCVCSVDEAAKRFLSRSRHPGHLDRLKTHQDVIEWLTEYEKNLPLSLGALEAFAANSELAVESLIGKLSNQIKTML